MRARQHGSQQPSAIGGHNVKDDLSVSHVQPRHCPNPALPALSSAKKIVTLARRGSPGWALATASRPAADLRPRFNPPLMMIELLSLAALTCNPTFRPLHSRRLAAAGQR